MKKRDFLKAGILFGTTAVVSRLLSACTPSSKATKTPKMADLPTPKEFRTGDFVLSALPYSFDALEPHIDRQTMEIHHGKHHAGYVKNLNAAVKDSIFATYNLEDILPRLTGAPEQNAIRNNAGGHWNHAFFWESMTSKGEMVPSSALNSAITAQFGGMDGFKDAFTKAAASVFGSGWAWLCVDANKKLFIVSTPNQDNPLMRKLVANAGTPILGLDVWEHAYYLKNQNRRADYIASFFKVIDWEMVSKRYMATING